MHLALGMILSLAAVGAGAGVLGAMVGIGGGVLLVPALNLLFDVDLKIAIATSLVAVVATSTAAGSVYVGRGLANMRLGMTLEITTTIGGIVGGVLAVHIEQRALSILFASITLVTAGLMLRSKHDKKDKSDKRDTGPDGAKPGDGPVRTLGWEEQRRLAGAYFDARAQVMVHYEVVRLWAGAIVALVAGILSGMLGIGGGFLKVPAMNIAMRVPLRVAAATSNVMIGVTAIASLFVYFSRGFVHPSLVAPVVLGVVVGSLWGTVLSAKASPKVLRFVLAGVLVIVAVEMILRARGVRVV
jgi:uncharacterized membrane protein YfcA